MIVLIHDLRIALALFVAALLLKHAHELKSPMIGYALAAVFGANALHRLYWLPWVNLRYEGNYSAAIDWAHHEYLVLPLQIIVGIASIVVIVIWMDHDRRRVALALAALLALLLGVDIFGRLMAEWWTS